MMSEEEFGLNSRKVLKGVGSTGALATGMGAMSTPVSATDTDRVERLDGSESGKAISAAKKTDAYNTLRDVLKEDEEYILRKKSKEAFRIDPTEGETFVGVVFAFETKEENTEVEIGIPLDDHAKMPPKATVMVRDDEKFPLQVDEFTLGKNVSADLKEPATESVGTSASTEDGSISRQVEEIDRGEGSVIKLSSDLAGVKDRITGEESEGVSIAVDPIPPESVCPMDNMPCWACKDGVSVVNVTGCGVYTWVICGAISIPTASMGGLACGVFVGLVCWAIHHYGINNPTRVCKKFCAC